VDSVLLTVVKAHAADDLFNSTDALKITDQNDV
jgi:hypothetical protein